MAAMPVSEEAPGIKPLALATAACAAFGALREGAPGRFADGWAYAERQSVITALDKLIEDATLYRGQVLLAHREDGTWGTALDRDFADWRGRTTGTGRGAAAGELSLAEGLDALPAVAEAVTNGEITLEHARALTRLRDHASAEVKEALSGDLGTDLLDLAKHVPAPELAKAARKKAAAIDAAAAQASFDAVHARRTFGSRRFAGGRKGEYFLNDVDGTTVETAIDAIIGTPAKDDGRTREQRRADALVTMANRVLQVGGDLNGAQVRPHLSLIVTEETWTATVTHRGQLDAVVTTPAPAPGQPGHSFYRDDTTVVAGSTSGDCASIGTGDGARQPTGDGTRLATTDGTVDRIPLLRPLGVLPPLPDVPPAELEDGSIVPLGELQRLMCDCEVTRIVMDARGVPLDVGQTERHYTKELRRAVTARDRHCRWPGCTLRASWCEVHHITWYSHGGATSIDNGLTLCTFHHHRVHGEHIRIATIPDGHTFHDRRGIHLGTTTYPPRRQRSRSSRATSGTGDADARTSDGLAPPRPHTAARALDGRGMPAAEGPAAPTATAHGAAASQGTAAPVVEGPGGAPTATAPGAAAPTAAAQGTAPPTAEGSGAPTAEGSGAPTATAPGAAAPTAAAQGTVPPVMWDVGSPPF